MDDDLRCVVVAEEHHHLGVMGAERFWHVGSDEADVWVVLRLFLFFSCSIFALTERSDGSERQEVVSCEENLPLIVAYDCPLSSSYHVRR